MTDEWVPVDTVTPLPMRCEGPGIKPEAAYLLTGHREDGTPVHAVANVIRGRTMPHLAGDSDDDA